VKCYQKGAFVSMAPAPARGSPAGERAIICRARAAAT
jgi:hypothetical protein